MLPCLAWIPYPPSPQSSGPGSSSPAGPQPARAPLAAASPSLLCSLGQLLCGDAGQGGCWHPQCLVLGRRQDWQGFKEKNKPGLSLPGRQLWPHSLQQWVGQGDGTLELLEYSLDSSWTWNSPGTKGSTRLWHKHSSLVQGQPHQYSCGTLPTRRQSRLLPTGKRQGLAPAGPRTPGQHYLAPSSWPVRGKASTRSNVPDGFVEPKIP